MLHLREFGYLLAFVMLALALYVGLYYVMVRTELDMMSYMALMSPEIAAKRPAYTVAPDLSRRFFRPMHAVDRWIRPGKWK